MLCLSQLAVAQRGRSNSNDRNNGRQNDNNRNDRDRGDQDQGNEERYADWEDYVSKNKNRYDWGRGPKPGIFAWRVWGDRVYTDDDALVGIRTSNPLFALDVNGQVNATEYLLNGQPLSLGSSVWTVNGDLVTLPSGNKVGIGLTNPAYELDVLGTINATQLLINGEPLAISSNSLSSTDGYELIAGGTGLNFNYQNTLLFSINNQGDVQTSGSVDASEFLIDGTPLQLPDFDASGNLNVNGIVDADGFTVNGVPFSTSTDRLVSTDGYNLVAADGLTLSGASGTLMTVDSDGNADFTGSINASEILIDGEALSLETNQIGDDAGLNLSIGTTGLRYNNQTNNLLSVDDEGNLSTSGTIDVAGVLVNGSALTLETDHLSSADGFNLNVGGDGLDFNYQNNDLLDIDGLGNVSTSGTVDASGFLVNGEALDFSTSELVSDEGYRVGVDADGIEFSYNGGVMAMMDDEGEFTVLDGSVNATGFFLSDSYYYMESKPNMVFDGVEQTIDGYNLTFNYNGAELASFDEEANMTVEGTIDAAGFLIDGEPLSLSSDRILPVDPDGVSVIAGDEAVVFSAEGQSVAEIDYEGSFYTQGSVDASAYYINGQPLSLDSDMISSTEGYSVNTYSDGITFEYDEEELLTVDSVGNAQIVGYVDAAGFLVNGEALSIEQNSISYEGQDTTYSVSSNAEGVSIGRSVTGNNEEKFLIVDKNGLVGIGTSTPDKALTVKGQIHAEEIKIDLNVPVPDYVFESDYDLKPIEETEAYIKENKHLPYMASAADVKEEGLTVGENQMNLLRTVEEMMLYQIEMNKQLELLKKQNEALQEKVRELERKIEE